MAIVLLVLKYLKSEDEIEGSQSIEEFVERPADNSSLVTDGGLRGGSRDRICLYSHILAH